MVKAGMQNELRKVSEALERNISATADAMVCQATEQHFGQYTPEVVRQLAGENTAKKRVSGNLEPVITTTMLSLILQSHDGVEE